MIDNPLEQPAPEGTIDRIRVFARDLAYGVVNNIWGTEFGIQHYAGDQIEWINYSRLAENFDNYLEKKWDNNPPNYQLLTVFGYFISYRNESNYLLTDKAFQLLELPPASPTIFISYGHRQSSELSLLIEARLRYIDRQIGIFIDKSIPLGDGWHQHLQDQVQSAGYFICLLGQLTVGCDENNQLIIDKTIDREPVQNEIRWALESDKQIIFICHRGYSLPDVQNDIPDKTWNLIEKLKQKQGIIVSQESADQYETAINKLLNRLQYATF